METGNRSTDHEKTATERGCGSAVREKTSSERGCSSALRDLIRGATDSSRVHLWQFRSLFLVDAAIIVVAVMAFGLLGILALDLNEKNAIVMIFMVPFMAAAVGVSSNMLLKGVRRRMNVLLDATHRVSDGDLEVEIDLKDADEYTAIYQNFNAMVKELKATKEEMSSAVNVLAHEFKTPITSMSGFADYLIRTGGHVETPERMEYLQIIHDESMRLAALSQNTLLLSKVEACQIVTDKTQYDLSEQIRRCVLLLLPQMEQKNITPVIDLPEMTWYGNAELMEQVWINLLNNALKFTPEGGTITAAGKICAERLRVTIADDGVGMSEETVSHIFEKYYQNDQVSAVRGNGIGLSIVARIVQLSGGQVEVESRQGAGSAFTVVLPAAGFPCIREKAFDRKGETAI